MQPNSICRSYMLPGYVGNYKCTAVCLCLLVCLRENIKTKITTGDCHTGTQIGKMLRWGIFLNLANSAAGDFFLYFQIDPQHQGFLLLLLYKKNLRGGGAPVVSCVPAALYQNILLLLLLLLNNILLLLYDTRHYHESKIGPVCYIIYWIFNKLFY